ncbi:conserved membrane domain protein [Mycobacterium kansasii]|uniref:Conserved membrane domain protein n=1 Tax=Mycobacterium kansasii TaxID=1768 RepID=A0A1V3WMK3_MYCKA|nr:conserved membrane domain protein [Mycobacterium kansasii]
MLQWLQHDIIDRGRLPLLCCLVAFILTFFVTRTFARIIRRRPAMRHRPAGGSPAISTSGPYTSTMWPSVCWW